MNAITAKTDANNMASTEQPAISAVLSSVASAVTAVSFPPPSVLSIAMATLYLVESVLILFLNGFAVIFIVSNKKMQTQVNKVILSLLTADLLISAMLPFHASFLIIPSLSLNHYACVLRYAINYVAILTSVLSLLMVTCDRYVAIAHPYYYSKHGSLQHLNVFIAGIWIYSLGYGLTVILWHHWPVACNPEVVMYPGCNTIKYFIPISFYIY